MKKVTVAMMMILALLAVSSPALAAKIEVAGDVYVGFFDKYLWRGFDLSGGQPVLQGGVDLSAKGLTLSYWTNVQLSDDDGEGYESGEATENDFIIDYTHEFNDVVSASIGNITYMLDELDDTNELYLGVSLSTVLEPSLTVYYDWDEAEENGLYYIASIGHSFDLASLLENLSVSVGAAAGYNDQSDYAIGNFSDFHNYELSTSLDYTFAEQFTVTPSFLFSSAISNEAKDAIDSEVLAGLTMTFAF